MTRGQIGNPLGVAAAGSTQLLGTVTADGVNTVTIDNIRKLRVGDKIDILVKATGVVVASNRAVTGITSTGVVTYDGADVAAAIDGTVGVYFTGEYARDRINTGGGQDETRGLDIPSVHTVAGARARLKEISSSEYTDTRLDSMTFNDMAYAIRLNDESQSIKST